MKREGKPSICHTGGKKDKEKHGNLLYKFLKSTTMLRQRCMCVPLCLAVYNDNNSDNDS